MAQASKRSIQMFCWLFVVMGVAIAGFGVRTMIQGSRTERWPVTDGVIESAQKKYHPDNDGTGTYSAEVTYTYQVGGTNYRGDKISIGQMSSSLGYAQGVLNRYPIGKKVPVHYSPDNPMGAVLETGVHGGAWIGLAVGTVFALFGLMFLQIFRAAAQAQTPGASQSSSVTVLPDGRVTMAKPPFLMGVIFLLAGVGICFASPSGGTPDWVVQAAGGMFALVGVFIFLNRLENKAYSKIPIFVAGVLFLAIFHWVSFGPGERIGTSTTSFSQQSGVNVKTPFAIFTLALDVILVAGFGRWLLKRRNG